MSYFTSPMDSKKRAEPRYQGEDWKKRDPGNEVGKGIDETRLTA